MLLFCQHWVCCSLAIIHPASSVSCFQNDSDQKKMKSSFTVQMSLWKVHRPETHWIQLGSDLPSHALVLSPLQSSAESQPCTCAQGLLRLPTLLFVSWWHLEGPYQQLMTDTVGWWDRQMGKSKRGGAKDSLRWAELLQSMQHIQDKARTRVLPHFNTLNTRQRHLSEEPQC